MSDREWVIKLFESILDRIDERASRARIEDVTTANALWEIRAAIGDALESFEQHERLRKKFEEK